jgi:hypothetical protein
MQVHRHLFIGGTWVEAATSSTIEVISPHTEEVIGCVPEAREADIDRAVTAARRAFDGGPWPRMSGVERAEVMGRLLAALQARAEVMATTITTEMGSPISFSQVGQVMASNMVLDYFTRLAAEYAFEEVRPGMIGPALVRREPVGVCAAILPWNVPQFIAMLKLARNAPRRHSARRGDHRGRAAAGGGQHRAGRTRDRRVSGHTPRHRQGELHRQHCCRAPHRFAVRRTLEARHSRARW